MSKKINKILKKMYNKAWYQIEFRQNLIMILWPERKKFAFYVYSFEMVHILFFVFDGSIRCTLWKKNNVKARVFD